MHKGLLRPTALTYTTYKLVRNKIDNYLKENSKEHWFRESESISSRVRFLSQRTNR